MLVTIRSLSSGSDSYSPTLAVGLSLVLMPPSLSGRNISSLRIVPFPPFVEKTRRSLGPAFPGS